MKLFYAALDAVFVARPLLLVPVWGFCVFGYWRATVEGKSPSVSALWGREHAAAFVSMLVFSCAVASVYVLNQIADRQVDRMNKGFAMLARGNVGRKLALASACALALTAVLIPAVQRSPVMLYSVSALILGVLYSFRPTYFSGRPLADFVANAFGYGVIAFGAGWTLAGASALSGSFALASLPYFLLMAGGSICSTLPDYEGDKAGGKRTTVVAMGRRRAHVLATLLLVAGCVSAALVGDWVALVMGAGALPVFLAYALHPSAAFMEATYKVTGAFAMLLAACLYPLMVPVSLALLAATWTYFRLRHHVSYPSLVPVSYADKNR